MGGKDLAGLAALGALGYMLSKKGKDDSGMDAEMADRANAVSRGRTDLVDTGMSEAEPGWETKERGAPGTSETVTPSASSLSKVQSAVRNPSTKMASQQFPMTAAPKYEPPAPKPQSRVGKAGQASGSSNEPSFQDKMAMEYLQNKRDRESGKSSFGTSQRSRPYMKDGGVVKMAKGGLTGSSASRRADGIAQRGKTKGTMVMCGGGYTKGKK